MVRPWAILVVGAGSIGERHIRCFQATGRARVSVCEIQASLRDQVQAKYGLDRAYGELDAALGDRLPDAAVIAVPAHLHVPLAMQLARAGVHLLIEKPLSTSLEGVAALEEAVREHGVKAAVAYVYRAHPVLEAMRGAIRSGRFGPAVELIVHAGQHFPTYRPAYRDIYYKDRATGGGAIQDALTHLVNAAQWIVGPVTHVVADAAHLVLDGVDVEDTVHVLARHGNVLACYSLNQHQAPNEVSMTVVCREGTCRMELDQGRWRWVCEPGGPWHDETMPLERDALFTRQAHAFLDFLDGTHAPLCTLDEAAQTLRANLAILQSVMQGGWCPCRP